MSWKPSNKRAACQSPLMPLVTQLGQTLCSVCLYPDRQAHYLFNNHQ